MMARPWWRANLLPALALVVLLPLTAGTITINEWRQSPEVMNRAEEVTVDPEAATEVLGGRIGPVRAAPIEDLTGMDVPPGTRLLAARVEIDGGSAGILCGEPSLVEQSSGRLWMPSREEIGLTPSPQEPTSCTGAPGPMDALILPYLVPTDVEGPFWIEIEATAAQGLAPPVTVRIPVEA
ncbi:hypothetical protein [Brachybacterium hainanense]|uniref:Peptidase n=1 Tax=Brachybacterium hainanense TaxID=1541174 RepID=A0ABV6R7U8_9MICO